MLSIAIPSYNSQDYMRNCIDSLLTGGEEVEILIVDDGSKDATPQIADEYAGEVSDHRPGSPSAQRRTWRGGQRRLRHASGFFYKVVDSDDWVDQESYEKVLSFLRQAVKEEEPLDMLICNYVYEKQGAREKR